MKTDMRRTFIELQLRGVSGGSLEPGRKGGGGPCGMRAFLFEEPCVMLPVNARPGGPFRLKRDGEALYVTRGGERLMETRLVPRPRFYDFATADGVPHKSVALLHGKDCLASTVVQQCSRYARLETRCRFCALGESLKAGNTILRNTPGQLAEVAAAQRSDGGRHVTLISGTAVHRDRASCTWRMRPRQPACGEP